MPVNKILHVTYDFVVECVIIRWFQNHVAPIKVIGLTHIIAIGNLHECKVLQ